jgi:hypothetical protein
MNMSEEKHKPRREFPLRICESRKIPDLRDSSKKHPESRQEIGRSSPLCASKRTNHVGNP